MQIHRLFAAFLALTLFPMLASADVKVGDKPTLQFTAFDSKDRIDLGNLKGKIVVVDFWATWCGPCMGEASHMVAVNQKYAGNGFQFIGISLDSDTSSLKKVIAEKKFTWPMSYEGKGWQGETPRSWGVNSIPQTFIFGPDGTVLWRGHPTQIDEPLAAAFRDHPPVMVDPKITEQAKSTLDQVDSNLASGQTAKAAKLLSTFPVAAKADPDLAARLTVTTTKVQDAASLELAAVDPLITAEQYPAAIKKLRDISQNYAGLPVAASATAKLKELASNPKIQKQITAEIAERDAADGLANAKQLKSDKKDELAYSRFVAIAKSYPNTKAGAEAASSVKTYEADTAFMQKLSFNANHVKAESMLSMADNYRSAGSYDLARTKYQAVIQQFPNTTWAATAQKAITTLAN